MGNPVGRPRKVRYSQSDLSDLRDLRDLLDLTKITMANLTVIQNKISRKLLHLEKVAED